MSLSPAASEEEEMTPPAKKPALSAAAPPHKPSTTTASKSPSKSLARIPFPQPSTPESSEEEEEEESTDVDSAAATTEMSLSPAATVIKLCDQTWGRGKKLVKSENGKAEKYFEDEVTAKRHKTEDEQDSVVSIPREASDQDNLLVGQHSHALLRELVLKTGTNLTASVVGEAVALIDGAKAEEIVGIHNKLTLLEMKINLRCMDLVQETVKLSMEVVEKLV